MPNPGDALAFSFSDSGYMNANGNIYQTVAGSAGGAYAFATLDMTVGGAVHGISWQTSDFKPNPWYIGIAPAGTAVNYDETLLTHAVSMSTSVVAGNFLASFVELGVDGGVKGSFMMDDTWGLTVHPTSNLVQLHKNGGVIFTSGTLAGAASYTIWVLMQSWSMGSGPSPNMRKFTWIEMANPLVA